MRECKVCKDPKPLHRFTFTGKNKVGKRYRRYTCLDCMGEQQQIYRDKKKDRAYTAKSYKLIYDPTGVYSVGARFSKGTVTDTLKDGYWPPGMWWEDTETSGIYEVQGNEDWHKVEQYIVDQRTPNEENHVKRVSQHFVRRKGDRQPPGGR